MINIFEYITEKVLIIIPVLLIIGQIIRNSEVIQDKFIPLILLPIGIICSLLLGGFDINHAIQGILVAGVAIFGNQIYHQIKKED